MTMGSSFTTRVTIDAALFTTALGLGAAWFGGRTALFGVLAGALLALADFWWLAARLDAVSTEAPGAIAWIGTAGLRLAVPKHFVIDDLDPVVASAG